jgi:hypothetical protein
MGEFYFFLIRFKGLINTLRMLHVASVLSESQPFPMCLSVYAAGVLSRCTRAPDKGKHYGEYLSLDRDHSRNLGVDHSIILKLILHKYGLMRALLRDRWQILMKKEIELRNKHKVGNYTTRQITIIFTIMIMLHECNIWDFHGGDYEEWRFLGCNTVWLL